MYSACFECKVSQLVRIFTSVVRPKSKCPLGSKEWTHLISALLPSHSFYCSVSLSLIHSVFPTAYLKYVRPNSSSSGPLFRFVWPFNCISQAWSLTETSNTCLWFKDGLWWSLLSDVSDLSSRCKPTFLLAKAVQLPSLVTKGTIVISDVLCITNLLKAIKEPRNNLKAITQLQISGCWTINPVQCLYRPCFFFGFFLPNLTHPVLPDLFNVLFSSLPKLVKL